MHWFDSQLQALYKHAEAYEICRANSSDDFVEQIRKTRTDFINNVQLLIDSIVKSSDISGCVVVHDGFLLAKAGAVSDTDALAAMMQESMLTAQKCKKTLNLGEIQQIVIVGETNKIAMISVGQVTLGILSAKQTNLAKSLRRKPR